MKVTIRCQHCKEKIQVDDWRDNCVCPKCGNFYISASEYIRQQLKGETNASN